LQVIKPLVNKGWASSGVSRRGKTSTSSGQEDYWA